MPVDIRLEVRLGGFSTILVTRSPSSSTTPYFRGWALSVTRTLTSLGSARSWFIILPSTTLSPGTTTKSPSRCSAAVRRAWPVPSWRRCSTYWMSMPKSEPSSK